MTTPKLLTRDELLRAADELDRGMSGARISKADLYRHLAALLPADGALPPIDNADEQIVDALVAKAQEGRTSRLLTPRQVTQTIEDLREAVRSQLQRERDAAIARAEAAEKRVAELEARWTDRMNVNYAAGIREGLERAAEEAEKWAGNVPAAKAIRALKEQVK